MTRNVLLTMLLLLPLAASLAAGDPGVRVRTGEYLWVRVEKPAGLLPDVTTSSPLGCQTQQLTAVRVIVECEPVPEYGSTVNPLVDAPGPLTKDSQVQDCGGVARSHATVGQVWGYLYCGTSLVASTMDDASTPELELPTDPLGLPGGAYVQSRELGGQWPFTCDVDFSGDAGWVICQNAHADVWPVA